MSAVECPSWCVQHLVPADAHTGAVVQLSSPRAGGDAGWLGWLYQEAGSPVTFALEGCEDVDLPAEVLAALLAALAEPSARQALAAALAGAGIEVPEVPA